jgi:hypothetical protein
MIGQGESGLLELQRPLYQTIDAICAVEKGIL